MTDSPEKVLQQLAIRLRFIYNGLTSLNAMSVDEFIDKYYKSAVDLDDLFMELDFTAHDILCCIEMAKGIEEHKIAATFPPIPFKSTCGATFVKNRKFSDEKPKLKKKVAKKPKKKAT